MFSVTNQDYSAVHLRDEEAIDRYLDRVLRDIENTTPTKEVLTDTSRKKKSKENWRS